jgi:hypothetical protein
MSGTDMVNSPDHYNQTDIECIDAIKAALGDEGFVAYCRGNAIKYNWRAGYKFDTTEDLKKAAWYSSMAAGDDPRSTVARPGPELVKAAEKYKDAIESGNLVTVPERSDFAKAASENHLDNLRSALNFETVDDVVHSLREMGYGAKKVERLCKHGYTRCSCGDYGEPICKHGYTDCDSCVEGEYS